MTDGPGALAFVQSVDQVQVFLGQDLNGWGAVTLIGLASHLSLGLAAEQAGLQFRPYSDWLDVSGFCQAATEAQQLCLSWFGDASGLGAIRLEIQQALNELLLAQRVMARALSDVRPAALLLPSALDAKVAAVARCEAEQRGISVHLLPKGWRSPGADDRPSAPRRRGPAARKGWGAALQVAAHLAHNAAVLARHGLQQGRHPRPVLLSFGSGVDAVNQGRLLPAIEGAGLVRAISVRPADVDPSAFNRPGHSRHPHLYFIPWRAMLRSRKFEPQCLEWLAAFRQRQEAYQGEVTSLFANRWLDPYFERLFRYQLPRVLATRRDAGALLDRLRPDVVMTSNEVSFPVRVLVSEAKRRRISTLGLIHSGLNHMLYRDFQSEHMAVWGRVHLDDFVRVLGKEPAQLIPIGNPQYDTFACGEAGGPSAGSGEPPCPRVLVLTAVSQWHMYYIDLRRHEQAWRELEHLPEAAVQVIVKPHPRFDDYAFYRQLHGLLPDWRDRRPGIALVQDAYLEEVLPTCDLVVVPSFPTTAAVEAMLCHKPVLYVACGTAEIPFCTSIAGGCLVVDDAGRIVPTILDVLRSPLRQAELVRRGQAYLDELLGPRDGRATQRLADLIGRLAVQHRLASKEDRA